MIAFEELRKFARAREGYLLPTVGGRAKFKVYVHEDGFEYIPVSSREPRNQKNDMIERIIDYYNQTNSLKTTDYHDYTVDASYTLGLIKLMQSKKPKVPARA